MDSDETFYSIFPHFLPPFRPSAPFPLLACVIFYLVIILDLTGPVSVSSYLLYCHCSLLISLLLSEFLSFFVLVVGYLGIYSAN